MKKFASVVCVACVCFSLMAEDVLEPFSAPSVVRENIFAFTEKPEVKSLGNDKYEITFAVKGNCDVTVGVVDKKGKIIRHLGSGVLGSNAPKPFQKNSLSQKIIWAGKDDLGVYVKEVNKLKIRVMLGLKPVFDKRLGGTSGKNLPGGAWGIAIDQSGAYVVTGNGGGFTHSSVRKFGHDGKYMNTVFPPSADVPLKKSVGMSYVEYEKGKRTRHGNNLNDSVSSHGTVMRGTTGQTPYCQVTLSGNRLVYLGTHPGVALYSVHTDGTSDAVGQRGIKIQRGKRDKGKGPWLASSPDGKWVYIIATLALGSHVVYRMPVDGSKKMTSFIGKSGKPGRDNVLLNGPSGIDCDAQGRIYVSDSSNSRIQIFSPEGKFLKSIKMSGPRLICVHKKTGAIYVQHRTRIKGKSVATISKLTSFDKPTVAFSSFGISSAIMALDSWSSKPRLWVARMLSRHHDKTVVGGGFQVMEEDGKKLKLISDFYKDAKKEDGDSYAGGWAGDVYGFTQCDPTREQMYYRRGRIFDLKTGKHLGGWHPSVRTSFSDFSFDKRGFMHLHFNPANYKAGVSRVDPSQAGKPEGKKSRTYPEIPYDYGVQKHGWKGMIVTKDQPGAKTFQDGLGVNMHGDIIEQCNIYFVPKMENEGYAFLADAMNARIKSGVYVDSGHPMRNYAKYMKGIKDMERRGEMVYSIKRRPGHPIMGGTAWTFNRTGELLQECAVVAGDVMNGTQIDEDRALYFVSARPKLKGGKPFLYGRAGMIGGKPGGVPFTGTLVKTKAGEQCTIVLPNSVIPMDPLPARPPEVLGLNFMVESKFGKGGQGWVEGAQWLYAGASPIVGSGCSCPRQHIALDWYKRVFVPEAYRHSIGILDTNGNLIMHLGRYGNFDDAPGGKSGAKKGGEDIKLMLARFPSVTDNYLTYGDWTEKAVVLKLTYHAEASVKIKTD